MRYSIPSFLLFPRGHRSFTTLFPLRRSSLRPLPDRPPRLPNPPARRSPPFKPPPPPSPSFWHELHNLLLHHPFFRLLYLVTWAPVLLFLHHNVFQIVSVDGLSMYPLLNKDLFTNYEKDKIAVWLLGAGRGLKRGKVVMFWSPNDPERLAVKRIIALEGDTVITREPYPVERQVVPQGHVWVEGENPEGSRQSADSNLFGPIPQNLIFGKVIGITWPWHRRSWISADDWNGSDRVIKRRKGDELRVLLDQSNQ